MEERSDTPGSTNSDEFTETLHNLKVAIVLQCRRGEKPSCPQKISTQFIRLKLYTGAQGNALPVRPFRQMYGDIEPKEILTPTLTAYSGEEIKCVGSITIGCKSGSSSWVNTVFYIVDVPGPVILGPQTCEALKLVTINCQLESVVTTPVKVNSVHCQLRLGGHLTLTNITQQQHIPTHQQPVGVGQHCQLRLGGHLTLTSNHRHADRQTDRQTDKTDRQTEQ